ncbi:hypothetical protein R1flu_010905 [Riccia fluitans]|uniref:Uncharacterized protein n=1 Tax=Riccia fluitans TaxID=41844 RepID=A0ABD1Z6B1_9MARC
MTVTVDLTDDRGRKNRTIFFLGTVPGLKERSWIFKGQLWTLRGFVNILLISIPILRYTSECSFYFVELRELPVREQRTFAEAAP